MRLLSSLWQACKGQVKFFTVVLLGYLLQACVMPYLKVGGVTPNLLLAVIAIVTVGYGRLRALWVGAIYGILTETMMPSLTLLNLALYPVSAAFMSMFFADKSEKRLEYERSLGKAGRNVNPYLRTLGCTAMNVLLYEIVNAFYMYLSGADLSMTMLYDSLTNVLATSALTAVIMLPVRRFLGFKRLQREPARAHAHP